MKIIAKRMNDDVFLIDLDIEVNGIPQGSVVYPGRGKVFPAQGIGSILARGYWEDYQGEESVVEVLARTRDNSVLA